MASCRIGELWKKDVVCVDSGVCLGRVDDVEVDVCTAQLTAIVIYGRSRHCHLWAQPAVRAAGTGGRYGDLLAGHSAHRRGYRSGAVLSASGRAQKGSVLLPGFLKRCGYNGFYPDFSGRDFSGRQQSVTLSEDGFSAAQSQTEEKAAGFSSCL